MGLIYFLKLIFHERCLLVYSFVQLFDLIHPLLYADEVLFCLVFCVFFMLEGMPEEFFLVVDGLELIETAKFLIIFEETFLQVFHERGLDLLVRLLLPSLHDS